MGVADARPEKPHVVVDLRLRRHGRARTAAAVRLVDRDARGIAHYADDPECTWYDFACAIVEELGADVTVKPVSTEEFPRPAARPAYSVLSTEHYERLTGVKPQSWREGLREYLGR